VTETTEDTPPRRRRWLIWTVVVVVVFAGGLGGLWYLADVNADGDTPAAEAGPPATTTVKRTDLSQVEDVDGTLGYGDTYEAAAGLAGVVTWLPAEGATVKRDSPLYSVDAKPVMLFYGSVPLYRTLRSGVDDGADVRELEQNLAALGYHDFTVDDQYTSATADVVRDWQEDAGLPETGTVEPGQIFMAPGEVRVTTHKVAVGGVAAPGRTVLTYTGTSPVIDVALDVADQSMAKKGGSVTVILPEDERVKGTIRSVGTVARKSAAAAGSATGGDSVIDLEVTLAKPARRMLDAAPVQVELVSEQRKNVLAVPISALLALREGGYGLELVENGTSRLIGVKVGLFADGMVEVSGAGLAEGATVGIPKP
jgi:peptidoglycan hydrolase-like protein with peptidoglycan-binding domain